MIWAMSVEISRDNSISLCGDNSTIIKEYWRSMTWKEESCSPGSFQFKQKTFELVITGSCRGASDKKIIVSKAIKSEQLKEAQVKERK